MSPPAHVRALLDRLTKVKRSGHGWVALCPAHEDSRASLSIGVGQKGQVLVNCHAGCNAAEVASAVGLSLKDFYPEDAVTTRPAPRRSEFEARMVTAYNYEDPQGELVYQVVRLTNPKDFRQRRPNGGDRWTWSMKGVERVPYRLPELLEDMGHGRTVFLVEGEKDADRLRHHGVPATTTPGGSAAWRGDYAKWFAQADVCIIPDHDRAGYRYARDAAGDLEAVANSVTVLDLFAHTPLAEKAGPDVSDWLERQGDPQRLAFMVEDAIPATTFDFDPVVVTFPAPVPPSQLADEPEGGMEWVAEGLIPAGANVLTAGYPKCNKTWFYAALHVAAALGQPFLGKHPTGEPRKTAIVVMEGREHTFKRRLARIAQGYGATLEDLDPYLRVWYRPPLRFSSEKAMDGLAHWCEAEGFELLTVDAWVYVHTGRSRDEDDVAEQLNAFTEIRDRVPGLGTHLIHHARKEQADAKGDRLTDVIRGSGAFGGWYDAGLVLSRKDEMSPTNVRVEQREAPPLEPFSFTLMDEHPATADTQYPTGWIRLDVSDKATFVVEREAKLERLVPQVAAFVESNGWTTAREIRKHVPGRGADVDGAAKMAVEKGLIRFDLTTKKYRPKELLDL